MHWWLRPWFNTCGNHNDRDHSEWPLWVTNLIYHRSVQCRQYLEFFIMRVEGDCAICGTIVCSFRHHCEIFICYNISFWKQHLSFLVRSTCGHMSGCLYNRDTVVKYLQARTLTKVMRAPLSLGPALRVGFWKQSPRWKKTFSPLLQQSVWVGHLCSKHQFSSSFSYQAL